MTMIVKMCSIWLNKLKYIVNPQLSVSRQIMKNFQIQIFRNDLWYQLDFFKAIKKIKTCN